MPSVTISPEYFKKEFNEYEDWHWAWVREIMQNSIDAGSSCIRFDIEDVGDETHVTVTNDGEVMTETILIDKLLALGASGKNFGGAVGGFGKAKNILFFCHNSWRIETGDMQVSGVGGDYEVESIDYFAGTRTSVVMDGHHCEDLVKQLHRFARYAKWSGVLQLNGEVLECDQNKGAYRRDLGFGLVYTNKSDSNQCVVRIGGIPMFVQFCGHDRLVIVELSGRSDEVLTSNRDGLVSPYRGELASFITELSVDKRSALRPHVPHYEHFAGRRLGHSSVRIDARRFVEIPQNLCAADAGAVSDLGAVSGSEPVEGISVGDSPNLVGSVRLDPVPAAQVRAASYCSPKETRRVVTIGEEFIIKNETGLVIPDYYRPDSPGFSGYSRKLIKVWGRLMVEMHRLFDRSDSFAVGFIFEDGDTMAEHEVGQYDRVYYIAPAEVVEQQYSNSKSFKKRWKLTDRGGLISTAAHEFVHGLGYDWHDERYANKFTEVMGIVMDNRKRFGWCFK